MGYTNEEKMLLLDKLFEQFKSVMGYYPRVLGSWFFDTFTARYVSVCDDELVLIYKGNKYALKLQCGKFVDSNTIESTDSKIIVEILLVK